MPTGGSDPVAGILTAMTVNPSRNLAFVGVLLILVIGVIHAVEAPGYLDEQAYVGVLFVLNAIGSFVVAGALAARPGWRAAWGLGALIAAGSFVAFVLSRTTGLPSFKEEGLEGFVGVLSLVVEVAFVFLAAGVLVGAGRGTVRRPARSAMGAAQRPSGY